MISPLYLIYTLSIDNEYLSFSVVVSYDYRIRFLNFPFTHFLYFHSSFKYLSYFSERFINMDFKKRKMKKLEMVYREMLYQAIERKRRILTQADLARNLHVSLSTVNAAVKSLEKMGAVDIKPRALHIIDIKKILYYWASVRNLQKDVVYSTRVEKPVSEIEKSMPNEVVFAAYTAYKFLFNKDVPADYSEVYVYGDEYELKKGFPLVKGVHNLFVLRKDAIMERYGKITSIASTFVDLWNLREWYAKEFVKEMEEKIGGVLE